MQGIRAIRTIRAIRNLLLLILSRITRLKRMTRTWSSQKIHFTIVFGVDTTKAIPLLSPKKIREELFSSS